MGKVMSVQHIGQGGDIYLPDSRCKDHTSHTPSLVPPPPATEASRESPRPYENSGATLVREDVRVAAVPMYRRDALFPCGPEQRRRSLSRSDTVVA